MAEVQYYPLVQPEPIKRFVNMGSTANTAHVGDYLAFSGDQVIAVSTANAFFRASGIGIALDQNPKWTNQGSAYHLTGMPVGVGGIYRVSAVSAVYSAGDYVFPVLLGSGQVGQTGRTGRAAVWSATAAYLTGTPVSAVGRILKRLAQGATTGQLDIELFALGGARTF
jgi:hypothetical protein